MKFSFFPKVTFNPWLYINESDNFPELLILNPELG